jgi:hypothetical protein
MLEGVRAEKEKPLTPEARRETKKYFSISNFLLLDSTM